MYTNSVESHEKVVWLKTLPCATSHSPQQLAPYHAPNPSHNLIHVAKLNSFQIVISIAQGEICWLTKAQPEVSFYNSENNTSLFLGGASKEEVDVDVIAEV